MPIVNQYRVQVDVQAWTPQGAYYHQDLMGDLKTIQTSKTTSQPYGTWTMTFTMREDQHGSWADKLTYRTYVEMRAGLGTGEPNMLMRGFVDAPGQTLQMPGYPAGPQREVTVSGRDMGAILADWQVTYLWAVDPMALYLESHMQAGDALAAQLGISVGTQSPNTLLKAFIDKLVNGPPGNTSPTSGAVRAMQSVIPAIPTFIPQLTIPDAYQINFLSLQPWQGSYSNFLDYFASPPWGEDFVWDADSGPILVVRQTPYKNYFTGQYPLRYNGSMEELGYFPDITLAAGDVTAHQITVNGANQIYTYYSTTPDLASSVAQSYAQFFYVSPGTTVQTSSDVKGQVITQTETIAQQQKATTGGNLNQSGITQQTSIAQAQQLGSNPFYDVEKARYMGMRPLQLQTPWVSTLQGTFGPDAQKQVADLNTWLVNVFSNNDRFSSGTITCHGFPEAQVGRYVVVEPGTITSDPAPWEGYLQQVDSQIDIYSGHATWTMDLGVVRGRVRA